MLDTLLCLLMAVNWSDMRLLILLFSFNYWILQNIAGHWWAFPSHPLQFLFPSTSPFRSALPFCATFWFCSVCSSVPCSDSVPSSGSLSVICESCVRWWRPHCASGWIMPRCWVLWASCGSFKQGKIHTLFLLYPSHFLLFPIISAWYSLRASHWDTHSCSGTVFVCLYANWGKSRQEMESCCSY